MNGLKVKTKGKNKGAVAARQAAKNTLSKQLSKAQKSAAIKKMIGKPASKTNFGPVSTINTAPVAIGNTIRGANSHVQQTKTGVIVSGRDFMFAAKGTGTVQTWTMCGGSPLTPAAFSDSVLANYMRTYSRFRWRSLVAHYITSSPTSANGDVLFYYSKDRSSVFLDQTSSQFLPFVISDPDTVMGPQWVNHSAKFTIQPTWKLTDYGMHDGIEEYAPGDLFLMSRTSTTSSPGYVLFDYVVEFSELQIQPRMLNFPIPRIQWHNVNLGYTALATGSTYSAIYTTRVLVNKGNDISGAASSLSQYQAGDIVKIIVDLTNSDPGLWLACTPSTLLATKNGGVVSDITVQDGTTFYGVYDLSNVGFALYANPTQAYDGDDNAVMRIKNNGTLTFNLQCWISYLGTSSGKTLNPSF